MNQQKIGAFLKTLRKEKNVTQEQLAQLLNVSRRSVSRWETGNNMPDLGIMVELSDYYQVDLRELLDGERRTEKVNKELEDTVMKVAEYSNAEKKKIARIVRVYFVIGIIALIVNGVLNMMELDGTFLTGFLEGCTFAMALISMIFGILYTTGTLEKIRAFKMRLLKGM